MSRARLLILSFSPIASDARVLKQVRHLTSRYDVTTCGYGPAPEGVVEHLELPAEALNRLDGRLITLRAYPAVYRVQKGVRAATRLLRGRRFDVALANDIDALPLALRTAPAVHSDLHEYFPRLHDDQPAWRRRIGPYQDWLCRRYLPRAASASTVSDGLAREYEARYGVPMTVVVNATPWADLAPGPVGRPLRLVHSGTSHRARNLTTLVEAAAALPDDVTLDLYLTGNDPAHLAELRRRAEDLANVTVHPPVPYADLVTTLNGYDVGLHLLPPATFNARWALPNKIFDYVQARLAVVVGPSPEMARVVTDNGVGVVAEGFGVDDLTAVLRDLDPARVSSLKEAAHARARDLSAEAEVTRWGEAVDRLAARVAAPAGRPRG